MHNNANVHSDDDEDETNALINSYNLPGGGIIDPNKTTNNNNTDTHHHATTIYGLNDDLQMLPRPFLALDTFDMVL